MNRPPTAKKTAFASILSFYPPTPTRQPPVPSSFPSTKPPNPNMPTLRARVGISYDHQQQEEEDEDDGVRRSPLQRLRRARGVVVQWRGLRRLPWLQLPTVPSLSRRWDQRGASELPEVRGALRPRLLGYVAWSLLENFRLFVVLGILLWLKWWIDRCSSLRDDLGVLGLFTPLFF